MAHDVIGNAIAFQPGLTEEVVPWSRNTSPFFSTTRFIPDNTKLLSFCFESETSPRRHGLHPGTAGDCRCGKFGSDVVSILATLVVPLFRVWPKVNVKRHSTQLWVNGTAVFGGLARAGRLERTRKSGVWMWGVQGGGETLTPENCGVFPGGKAQINRIKCKKKSQVAAPGQTAWAFKTIYSYQL